MVHFHTRPSCSISRRSSTPNGQAGTQYPQPLQTSCCTSTVPCSVRISAPVGQTSRQAACVQCLQTSDDISQRTSEPAGDCPLFDGMPRSTGREGTFCSTKATCR